jgi:hypothetical protein
MPLNEDDNYNAKLSYTICAFFSALKAQIESSNHQVSLSKYTSLVPLCQVPSDDVQRKCIQQVSAHLSRHVDEYKVKQVEIDFFKVSAWLGMMLWHESGMKFNLLNLVSILNSHLKIDNRQLPFEIQKKIARMAANDKDHHKDGFAVGMNGLYLIFRACYKLEVTIPSNP